MRRRLALVVALVLAIVFGSPPATALMPGPFAIPRWTIGDFWRYQGSDSINSSRMEILAIETIDAAIPPNGTLFSAYRLAVSYTGPSSIWNWSGIQWRRTADLALFRQERETEIDHYESSIEPPSREWSWPLGLGGEWNGNHTFGLTVGNRTYHDNTLTEYTHLVAREAAVSVPAGRFAGYEVHGQWRRSFDGEELANGTVWTVYSPRVGNRVQSGSIGSQVTNDLVEYEFQGGPLLLLGVDPVEWALGFLIATVAFGFASTWKRRHIGSERGRDRGL